jgi:ABC-2 type transport system ATP-binding protein
MTARGGPALAVECRGVVKDYGAGRGVFDLDLEVRTGEVFGFIGPNGAGKTTTIRLLMDLVRPDGGVVMVLGLDSHTESLALKRRIGYLPGELAQFPGVSASYILGLLAGLRGDVEEREITALAERFQLDLRRKYEELSHGNKQKVALIAAFMHRPELLVLDEPTLGLDPLMQREFRDLVRERVSAGATVFLSSHVLSEVEQACDRLALIKGGRIVTSGTLEELRAHRTHRIEARIAGSLALEDLLSLEGVSDGEIRDHQVSCSVHGAVGPLLHTLDSAGVVELDSHEMSLEEVFFAQIGEPDASPAGR